MPAGFLDHREIGGIQFFSQGDDHNIHLIVQGARAGGGAGMGRKLPAPQGGDTDVAGHARWH
ncbi:hypothetical protein, partial [Komagataeibacter kakiaceti]|uniref:hypothetical protein n=1 Tax=Komagataeibacter kakiaceti TaxID=943261 RepID=UPI000471733E